MNKFGIILSKLFFTQFYQEIFGTIDINNVQKLSITIDCSFTMLHN